jgi:hypothetical protein
MSPILVKTRLKSMPPPMPWKPRKNMKRFIGSTLSAEAISGVAPQSAEPSRKITTPLIRNHLRPNWSESLPTMGIIVVEVRRYAMLGQV